MLYLRERGVGLIFVADEKLTIDRVGVIEIQRHMRFCVVWNDLYLSSQLMLSKGFEPGGSLLATQAKSSSPQRLLVLDFDQSKTTCILYHVQRIIASPYIMKK